VTEVFLTLIEVFPCFFLRCKANARVKLAKTGHGLHSTTLVCICVVRMLLFVLFGCYLCCSMYCLCVNVYCHQVTAQLQLINKYKNIKFLLGWGCCSLAASPSPHPLGATIYWPHQDLIQHGIRTSYTL
jgi:hypothetical protein